MGILPPLTTTLVTAEEYVLDADQELRLYESGPRRHRSRWLIAETGTPAPAPETRDKIFIQPWPAAWTALNDPQDDEMIGACVVDQDDPSRGIVVLIRPTPTALTLWARSAATGVRLSLGVETATHCTPPDADYRAVFPRVRALEQIADDTVRFAYSAAATGSGFEVVSANYVPPRLRRRLAEERGIEGAA